MAQRVLDVENIGRIGQMFISGDLLEHILIDRFTCDEDDTDYNIPAFNALKVSLQKIERINPELNITGVIWYWYPANRRMAVPAVAGRSHPSVGWVISPCDEVLSKTLNNGVDTKFESAEGQITYYFPIRNSADTVVGALELTSGGRRYLTEPRYDM